ncbi:LysR family transcriptional regulator [Solidesulfovibrio sp.]|uniref:LysR family transcriptional regulator n=1 Tax=Solidesulfovibrio sp. TaxID=2910990 RepID=UPI002609AD98|nr:LysR family transcriptional regulator [Solidesulfovibrio sp.]
MELADLHAVIAVVEAGGVTRAAACLHRVPSSVTTRILRLEEALGVRLFARQGKQMPCTPEGRTFYEYAKRIVALAQEAESQVRNVAPGGRFRIGAMESTAAGRLPKPLAQLYAQHPRLEIELTTGTSQALYEKLFANRLDAALIADAPRNDSLETVAVFTEQLVLIAPEGHPDIRTPADIRNKTALAFREGCSYRRRLLDWFHDHGDAPDRIAELASYHAILGGVSAGMGVGVVPETVLRLFPAPQTLTTHALAPPYGAATTELVWRKGMRSANVRALQVCLAGTAAAQ